MQDSPFEVGGLTFNAYDEEKSTCFCDKAGNCKNVH